MRSDVRVRGNPPSYTLKVRGFGHRLAGRTLTHPGYEDVRLHTTHHRVLPLDRTYYSPRCAARSDDILVCHGEKIALLHREFLWLLRDSLHVIHHFIETVTSEHEFREEEI